MSYSVSNDEQIQQTRADDDHPIGPIILLTQNPAYGEVHTRAEDDQTRANTTNNHPVKQEHNKSVSNFINLPNDSEVLERAEDDQHYYINEEMGRAIEVITRSNEAYISNNLIGSNPDPSIPTIDNQAYTSVSADTERVRDEEIYDYIYVREL